MKEASVNLLGGRVSWLTLRKPGIDRLTAPSSSSSSANASTPVALIPPLPSTTSSTSPASPTVSVRDD
eukprot:11254069-Prorocentrum_lima.AAC.1